jgi:molybdopterin-synthase adenylyltransferase
VFESLPNLTPDEQATYEWQMWIQGLGEEGQRKLKSASVLISRIGGVGGLVAYQLAAAGIGKLILAHAGIVKPSDLNRQILMTHSYLGKSRIESATHRLRELNPRIEIVSIPENVSPENASPLVSQADLTVCCVPLFEERLLLNNESVSQSKPLIDCAMYELTGQITTIVPGQTACIACRFPEKPSHWKREFPVLGAVAGTVGCLGATEAIKWICGFGEGLQNRLLIFDLRDMRFRTIQLQRNSNCPICGLKGELPSTTR